MSRKPVNRIKELRTSVGLSQNDLAERLNELARRNGNRTTSASGDSVSRWERGTGNPQPVYRRLLAEVLGVPIDALHLDAPAPHPSHDLEEFVETLDPRVERSRREWQTTRQALNAQRHALAQVAVNLYPDQHRLNDTGLITHPDWLPSAPVDLAAINLHHQPDAPNPTLAGNEPEADHTRPRQSLVRRYARYTQAIRDLAKPRLFENRHCWRITDLAWDDGKGSMSFADSTYFAACDVFETLAHEVAYVAVDSNGGPHSGSPTMRDLPYRRLVGDPFNLSRRPVMPAISTLTIRAGRSGADFLLHRRDPRAVTAAGGMLQVIPSGIFQPSSVMPAAQQADFDLWRNFMREFSEELLGNPEHDGDGQPVQYDRAPFATLEQARQDGRIRIYCLGFAMDALTLVGEVLTVAVVDADLFDELDRDFVDRNDEGQVVAERAPFTEESIAGLLSGGRLAPAGAGCVTLAWQFRDHIL